MNVRTLLPVLLAVLLLAGCASSREAARPAVFGTWDYSMSNPSQGTLSGQMTIEQAEDGTYTGRVSVVEMGINEPIAIRSLEIDGDAFTLVGSAAGSDFTITGVVEGDTMTGENDVAGVGVFSMRASRSGG